MWTDPYVQMMTSDRGCIEADVPPDHFPPTPNLSRFENLEAFVNVRDSGLTLSYPPIAPFLSRFRPIIAPIPAAIVVRFWTPPPSIMMISQGDLKGTDAHSVVAIWHIHTGRFRTDVPTGQNKLKMIGTLFVFCRHPIPSWDATFDLLSDYY